MFQCHFFFPNWTQYSKWNMIIAKNTGTLPMVCYVNAVQNIRLLFLASASHCCLLLVTDTWSLFICIIVMPDIPYPKLVCFILTIQWYNFTVFLLNFILFNSDSAHICLDLFESLPCKLTKTSKLCVFCKLASLIQVTDKYVE